MYKNRVQWQEWLLNKKTINCLGLTEGRQSVHKSENWYHTLQHLCQQPPGFPWCLSLCTELRQSHAAHTVGIHSSPHGRCRTQQEDLCLKGNVPLHLLPCHAQCSQGSVQASALPLGGGNEIISLHVLICLADFCSSSHHWDSLLWFIQQMSESVVIWIYWRAIYQFLIFQSYHCTESAHYVSNLLWPFFFWLKKFFFYIFLFQNSPEKYNLLHHIFFAILQDLFDQWYP